MNRYQNNPLPLHDGSLAAKLIKERSKRKINHTSTTRNRDISKGRNRISPSTSYHNKVALQKLKNRRISDHSNGKSRHKVNHIEPIEGKFLYFKWILEMTTTKSLKKDKKKKRKLKSTSEGDLFIPKQEVKRKRKSKGKLEKVIINLMNCKFEWVKKVATKKEFGLRWKLETNNTVLTNQGKSKLV